MIYTIYDPNSGCIVGTGNVSNKQDIGHGIYWIEGRYDSNLYYIEGRKPVLYPPKPNANTWIAFTWDLATHTWGINTAVSASNVRKIRDAKLAAVDRVNPIWYSSLTPLQQQQLKDYRSDLLNIPNQSGFPVTIDWPVPPAWL